MLRITSGLKSWAVQNLGVAAEASDAEFNTKLTEALGTQKLTASEFARLSEDVDPRKELASIVGTAVSEAMKGFGSELAKALKPEEKKVDTPVEPTIDPAIQKHIDAAIEKGVEAVMAKASPSGPSIANRLMASAASSQPRVKLATERYTHTKTVAVCPEKMANGIHKHPRAGLPAQVNGRDLEVMSDREKAVIGAFAKWQLLDGNDSRMSEHEKELVQFALREMEWDGPIGNDDGGTRELIGGRKLTEMEVKAVINDTVSGGNYAVPRVFDENIIMTPLLYGELFPYVDVVNLPRGQYIDGSTWTNVSWTSGTSEGTAFDLLTTTGLIGNLDTQIYPEVAAIELGLDWESDTPIDFGGLITKQLGQALQVKLDYNIAMGNGSTQPLGIFDTGFTSATTVHSTTSCNGYFVTGDVEKLIFGLSKAMRASNPGSIVFISNDTTYRRMRAIPTAVNWYTRALGMDWEGYSVGGHPWKIQNNIPDGYLGICNMSYYRMYRRLGMQVRNVVEGVTLARSNTRVLVFRARFGGQPTLGSAFCLMLNGATTDGVPTSA